MLKFGLLASFFLVTLFAIAQNQQTGLVFSDYDYQKIPKRYFSVRGVRELPKSHSLKQYCPRPLNQLEYNTSPGWATSYAAFTILTAFQNKWTGDMITKKAFSPIYPYFQAKHDISLGCTEDVSLFEVLQVLKDQGTPLYTQLPSRCIDKVQTATKTDAWFHKISEFSRLFDVSDGQQSKITAIKTTLSENVPVIAAMHLPRSFGYAKEFWQPREEFSRELPGQALCVVGYDDEKYGGAFEVMNSWGSEWGNDGFMWIRYDDFIEFTRYAMDLYVIPGRTEGLELGGSIELNLMDDQPMDISLQEPGYYKIARSYPSGTIFTIKVKNQSPAFVYAFASDLTGEIYSFFPPGYTSAAFAKASSFYVPDEFTPIEIDETLGTDYLCVLFSKEDLDINAIFDKIKVTNGSFSEKVRLALNQNLIPTNDVRYLNDQISFTVANSNQSVVMLVVEHDHH